MEGPLIVVNCQGQMRVLPSRLEIFAGGGKEPDWIRLSVEVFGEKVWMNFTPSNANSIHDWMLLAAGEIERALAAGVTGHIADFS